MLHWVRRNKPTHAVRPLGSAETHVAHQRVVCLSIGLGLTGVVQPASTRSTTWSVFSGAVLLQHLVACRLCLIRPGVSLGVRLGVPHLFSTSIIMVLVVACARRVLLRLYYYGLCRKVCKFICQPICCSFGRYRPLGKAQSHLQGSSNAIPEQGQLAR